MVRSGLHHVLTFSIQSQPLWVCVNVARLGYGWRMDAHTCAILVGGGDYHFGGPWRPPLLSSLLTSAWH
jgi:hypothetical protein